MADAGTAKAGSTVVANSGTANADSTKMSTSKMRTAKMASTDAGPVVTLSLRRIGEDGKYHDQRRTKGYEYFKHGVPPDVRNKFL